MSARRGRDVGDITPRCPRGRKRLPSVSPKLKVLSYPSNALTVVVAVVARGVTDRVGPLGLGISNLGFGTTEWSNDLELCYLEACVDVARLL